MTVHMYDLPSQPATRWVEWWDLPARTRSGAPIYVWDWRGRRRLYQLVRKVFTHPPGHLFGTLCCRRMRPAKNLHVQAFYDEVRFFCRDGTGCRA